MWVIVIWLRTGCSSWLWWSHIDSSISTKVGYSFNNLTSISFKHVAVICRVNWINCQFLIRNLSIWIFCPPITYIHNSWFLWSSFPPPPTQIFNTVFLYSLFFQGPCQYPIFCGVKFHDGWWIMNWEGYGSERLWSNLKWCLNICLDLQGKWTTKIPKHCNRFLGQFFNHGVLFNIQ